MTSKNTLSLLYGLSKVGDKSTFVKLLKHSSILNLQPDYIVPKDFALLVHSFSNIKIHDDYYWNTLETYFHAKRDEMNAKDLTCCLCAFAKTSKNFHHTTWQAFEYGLKANFTNFVPREFAFICQAFALREEGVKLSKPFLNILKLGVNRNLNHMTLQDLAILTWAFARLDTDDASIWTSFEKRIILERENWTPDYCVAIICSFAKASKGSDTLWNLMQMAIYKHIEALSERELTNIICAFSRARQGNEKFWVEVMRVLKIKLSGYDANNILCVINYIQHVKTLMPNFKEFVEEILNIDEHPSKMSYYHIMTLTKTLYAHEIKRPDLWDSLAVRLRQLIRGSLPLSNLKSYLYFIKTDLSYWDYVIEDAFIAYFNTIRTMEPRAREKAITIEHISLNIEVACRIFYNKMGSSEYWQELLIFLQYRRINMNECIPLVGAKIMLIVSKKFKGRSALISRWMEWEKQLFGFEDIFRNKFIPDLKSLSILIVSFWTMDREMIILPALQKNFGEIVINEEEIKNFMLKALSITIKPSTHERGVSKGIVLRALEQYTSEMKSDIVYGIMEEWFNMHLSMQGVPRQAYTDFMSKLLRDREEGEELAKEDSDEPDITDSEIPIEDEIVDTVELKEPQLELEIPMPAIEPEVEEKQPNIAVVTIEKFQACSSQ